MMAEGQTMLKTEEQELEKSVKATRDKFANDYSARWKTTVGLLGFDRYIEESSENYERCHSMILQSLCFR